MVMADWARGGCPHEGSCADCEHEGTSYDQRPEEVEWMRSACAYAQRGRVVELQRLLERRPGTVWTDGTGCTLQQGSGYTPLHYASREGHTECVRLLLRHGALPPAAPSSLGIGCHRLGLVWLSARALRCAGALVDSRTRAGASTSLHRAAYTGQLETLRLLYVVAQSPSHVVPPHVLPPHPLSNTTAASSIPIHRLL